MANFYQAATDQLAPVYDQQISQIQSQIPAIQQLYQTLTQSLQQQNQQQLQTGVQGIVEDASARGVLRSTLPVDSRTSLTGQLGAALNQGLGQLGLQQTQDVSRVNEQVGGLQTTRANAIAQLAQSLETQDLDRQKFELSKLQADRDYQLGQQQLALQRSSAARSAAGSTKPLTAKESAAQQKAGLGQYITQQFGGAVGKDGKVGNNTWAAALRDWQTIGGTTREFWQRYGTFVNPKFKSSYAGYAQR